MVEMGGRNWALGSVPHSGRRFAIKYQDRIMFGTDGKMRGDAAAQFLEYVRTLETEDDQIAMRRESPWSPTYGLGLPDEVLRKIYSENAIKLFPSLGSAAAATTR
jgi:predicted TIM-barrel fold metal-dependent hydrolase